MTGTLTPEAYARLLAYIEELNDEAKRARAYYEYDLDRAEALEEVVKALRAITADPTIPL